MTRASEVTPLLAASAEAPTTQADPETLDIHKIGVTDSTTDAGSNDGDQEQQARSGEDDDDRGLPVGQVFILCYARMIEPIAFFCIFPFINQMIHEVGGVREEDVGFWSGLIESLFSFTQMIFMISWGRASDRYGRKPVLVFSLLGVSVAFCIFSLSKTLWQMILTRCIAGMFAGTIVTVRTMLSEVSTPKTQARAFSWFAFSGNLGIFVGPLIGGVFANAATQYPRLFGNIRFLHEYPYALPSIISGVLGFSAVALTSLFLKETLEVKDDSKKPTGPPMSFMQLLRQPGVGVTLALWCFIMFQGLASTAIAPVYWFTSVPLGGLGFTPFMISVLLGAAGICQAIWLLFIFPPAQRRFGTGGVLKFSSYLFPIGALSSPLLNLLRRRGLEAAFWTLTPTSLVITSGGAMAYTAMSLAINNVSPSPAVFGTLNALALAMTAGIRAVAPGLFASLFATGVRTQILDGYLIWVVMGAMSLMFFVSLRFLPEKAGNDQQK